MDIATDDQLLAGLNPAQREAVQHTDGPLLILAGAGSGKTTVLTRRLARLIDQHGVDPSRILAVTFTNKAAGEMKERIAKLLQRQPAGMWVGTFHAIGARMLRAAPHLVGRTPSFTIYDQDDTQAVIKRIMERLKINPKNFTPRGVHSAISDAKNALVSPEEYASLAMDPFARAVSAVYNEFGEALRLANAVDFDDLLVLPVRMLAQSPSELEKYRRRFQYLLVDEYQDTNRAQYQLVKLLAGGHGNLCVVGDDDQCLVAGTMVTMADGATRAIEDVRVGDDVRSGTGGGVFRGARVTEVYARARRGEGIAITTTAGRRIVSTPEHTHFAGYLLGVVPQMHFVYLMRREGVGYRIGTSQVYTRGQAKPVVGFMQRLAQEHGDALWIVGTHESESEARAEEYILSLRYQIPTLPFVPRKKRDGAPAGNGLVHDEEYLRRVFASFDTAGAAGRLLADRGLSPHAPHYRPRSRNSNRRNLVITLCGEHRGAKPMHRIQIVGNDAAGSEALRSLALSVRSAKPGSASWRHETSRVDYAVLQETVDLIASRMPLNVLRMARLGRASADGETASLPFLPAASVMPGMAMFDQDGGFDIVASVERVELDEVVYDLNIEHTHNFVANGLVTHNSIYGWRGADIRNILDFNKDFPAAHVVRLEENYRSTPQVLDLANVVISANTGRMGKTLRPTHPSGERVTAVRCLDERDEADFVVEEMTTRRAQSSGLELRDIAVVYRTNAQSRALEEALRKRAVPYRLVGNVRFYDRREIKDLMAYLKLIANPADDEAFRRCIAVPKRGLGDTTIEALSAAARANGLPMLAAATRPDLLGTIRPAARGALAEFAALIAKFADAARESAVDELLKQVVEGIRYDEYLRAEGPESADRIENVRELITGAAEQVADEEGEVGLTPLDHFLQKAMLVAQLDVLGPDADAVTLMTLHNAKGLEFPVVFITGLEDGLFPLAKAYDDPAMLEEERRLFYVGITRAESKLYLTHAEERRRNGEFMPSKASSFLQAIPEDMLEQRKTIKVRSSGRSFMQSLGAGSQWGNSRRRPGMMDTDLRTPVLDDDAGFPPSAAMRRPGAPVTRTSAFDESEASQDAAVIAVGARVRHRKFGGGVIAELAGSGRDLKAKIDFDDEEIGRKTLVVAQANLERDID